MEKDMKKQIAEASRELLFEDQVKKLTVKAIVDKCKITRQAFYYHFEDIPDLLKWILDQASSQLEKEIFEQEDEEKVLKRCFLIAGILRNWTDEDSENLDHIVHEINLLMGGKIIP